MDKTMSLTTGGSRMSSSRNTALAEAFRALERVHMNGIKVFCEPQDFYFIERTLIELKLLTPARGGLVCHSSFFELLDGVGYQFSVPRPNKMQLAEAVGYITDDPFPWLAQPGPKRVPDANEKDLPRWRRIYRCLEFYLASPEEQSSAPSSATE